jgi:hypothetical protein
MAIRMTYGEINKVAGRSMRNNFDQDVASNGFSVVGFDYVSYHIRHFAAQLVEGRAFGMNAEQV